MFNKVFEFNDDYLLLRPNVRGGAWSTQHEQHHNIYGAVGVVEIASLILVHTNNYS